MHISLIESTAYEWWWEMCPCWKAIYSVTAGGIYFALWTYIDSVYCSVDFSLPPPLFILCLLKSFHPAASYISQHSMKESEKKGRVQSDVFILLWCFAPTRWRSFLLLLILPPPPPFLAAQHVGLSRGIKLTPTAVVLFRTVPNRSVPRELQSHSPPRSFPP